MTSRKWKALAVHGALAIVGVLSGVAARAELILEQNVMVSVPSVPRIVALGELGPGRWSVTVTDLGWPQVLQSLSFAVTDHTGVLASRVGAGLLVYDTSVATNLFAAVYALPSAAIGVGLYHINVAYTPFATPPPAVPLPAAIWLLASAVVGLGALRRKHATVTNSVVQ